MEGTHTVLQLHRPIMELCYVSFYLPRGKVTGFTYKGCVTLDKSSKCFHNCYQVKEDSEGVGSQGQSCEHIGEIFFKQTTTENILTELYKLNAEKDRILTTLLSSSHILGVKMGNQDGKLEQVSEHLKYKEEKLDFKDQSDSFSGSTQKSSLKNRKRRKSSKRRESIEEFINKNIKRKISATLDPPALHYKEALSGSDRYHSDDSSRCFMCSDERKVEYKGELSDGNKPAELSKRKQCLLEDCQVLESDSDLSVSFSEYDNIVFGHCFAHSSHSLLDEVEGTFKAVQQSSPLLNTFQEKLTSEERCDYSHIAGICKGTSEIGELLKRQDTKDAAGYSQVSCATSEENKLSTGLGATSEIGHEGVPQQSKVEQDYLFEEACSPVKAVNKTLQKVIQFDRLDESTEWKKLQCATSPSSFSHENREKRTELPQKNNNHLTLFLQTPPEICQQRTNNKQEEKKTPSPSLVAISNVFNRSYPSSNTYTQMSPLPSPLSSSPPSLKLHHRILPLTALDLENESVGHCAARHSSSDMSLCSDLEAQRHLKVSGSGDPSLFTRQQGLSRGISKDNSERSSSQEKISVQSQHQLLSGFPVETAWKKNSEQAVKTPVTYRDDDAWVLACRLRQSDPSVYLTEPERVDRSLLHLELTADVIPSEQDDKTPGRLQTVWPPPKAKDEEEKIGLKYTEAEYHAVILQLKREHKDEIEKLKIIKLLDGKRSQTVGILISSLHLEMKDIEQAVLNMDDSVVDLETLEALYENRAQKDELEKIKQHYDTSTEEEIKLLDKPEQFLYELSQISNFAERAQCIIFQSVFNEGIIAVHHKVDIVHHVCKELITMKSVKNILALVLAFGNYMNGGNRTRGQADGFGLEILPKLKDVKSRDTGISLADYVVIYYLRHCDKEAGTEKSVFPLPEPQDFFQASQVKFEDLTKDLRKLKRDLEGCEKQMKVVFRESSEEHLQPFKDKFEDFYCEAVEEHKAEKSHLENAQKCFEEMVKYYGIKPKSGEKETTPNYVFMVWYEFCSEFKTIWKRENKNISKERLRMAQQSVSKLTSEKKVETRKINPTASLVCSILIVILVSGSLLNRARSFS
ncbi:formin-1 isoform X5 [Ahaetulla prasina]|uniref:formin-1 isoform X5 n=1 Tax=Ahaetulla prasina TaxID=499056 RepID=UPI00264728D1|nr:formin-1 isoform X5 [Ahaetulla prasina]